jgi:hypothetical protein
MSFATCACQFVIPLGVFDSVISVDLFYIIILVLHNRPNDLALCVERSGTGNNQRDAFPAREVFAPGDQRHSSCRGLPRERRERGQAFAPGLVSS